MPDATKASDDTTEALAMLARGLAAAMQYEQFCGGQFLPRPTELLRNAKAAPAPSATHTPIDPLPKQPVGAAAKSLPVLAPPPAAGAPLDAVGNAALDAQQIAAIVNDPHLSKHDKLERLRTDVIGACTRCKLNRGRSKLVFGTGHPEARLVFVGEAPGADEDRQGIPFVGRAGQLLTKMIEAMGLKRDDVYICNVVKCRPPNNRDPDPDEVAACQPFLDAQLSIIAPHVIVGLGRHAAHTLLGTQLPISKLRGQFQSYRDIPLMPTYHPSYLLREEDDPKKQRKREAWADLKQVMERLAAS